MNFSQFLTAQSLKPLVVVSPMAGVTDLPFRQFALAYGADYAVSEMITAKTELWDSQKTQTRLKRDDSEALWVIQIAGASVEVIKAAVNACNLLNPAAIEINMGCPAKKVCNVLAGSALLQNESLVAEILHAAVAESKVPVLLKTRLGWDEHNQNIISIAKRAQQAGITALTIHGRTRADFYNNEARYDLIRAVKQQVTIPVFANGDITTAEKAKQVLEYTQANGIYIGRGALGQPWLFAQVKQYLAEGCYTPITSSEVKAVILQHLTLIHEHYGAHLGPRIARKHFKWYLQVNQELLGLDAIPVFNSFSSICEAAQQLDFVNQNIC